MQLPADEEVVMVAGIAPIRAKKLKYYEDSNFTRRVMSPPPLSADGFADKPSPRSDDWAALKTPSADAHPTFPLSRVNPNVVEEGSLQREPNLSEQPMHEPDRTDDFAWLANEDSCDEGELGVQKEVKAGVSARRAVLDRSDGIPL